MPSDGAPENEPTVGDGGAGDSGPTDSDVGNSGTGDDGAADIGAGSEPPKPDPGLVDVVTRTRNGEPGERR